MNYALTFFFYTPNLNGEKMMKFNLLLLLATTNFNWLLITLTFNDPSLKEKILSMKIRRGVGLYEWKRLLFHVSIGQRWQVIETQIHMGSCYSIFPFCFFTYGFGFEYIFLFLFHSFASFFQFMCFHLCFLVVVCKYNQINKHLWNKFL